MTFNDLEGHNSHYFALFHGIWPLCSLQVDYVTVAEDRPRCAIYFYILFRRPAALLHLRGKLQTASTPAIHYNTVKQICYITGVSPQFVIERCQCANVWKSQLTSGHLSGEGHLSGGGICPDAMWQLESQPFCSQANSLPKAKVPTRPWNFHYPEHLPPFLTTFTSCSFHSMELSLLGANVLENLCSLELSLPNM